MPPRRGYSEKDIQKMEHDAVQRIRDMRSRAQQTVDEVGQNVPPAPPTRQNQGWSTNPNIQRRRQQNRPGPQSGTERIPESRPGRPPGANNKGPQKSADPFVGGGPPPTIPETERIPEPNPIPPPTPPPEKTTIIEDVLGAVGLDDDRLLILGLLFILINAKADATVILALIYLLL